MLGDWLISGWAESVRQASVKRSRARSQLRWFLVLVREASSIDIATPEPRPDWALRNCSWIYNTHTITSYCTIQSMSAFDNPQQPKHSNDFLPDLSCPFHPCRAPLHASSPSSPASVCLYSHHLFHYTNPHKQTLTQTLTKMHNVFIITGNVWVERWCHIHMNRSRSVVSLECSLAPDRLPAVFSSVFIPAVLNSLLLFIITVLKHTQDSFHAFKNDKASAYDLQANLSFAKHTLNNVWSHTVIH